MSEIPFQPAQPPTQEPIPTNAIVTTASSVQSNARLVPLETAVAKTTGVISWIATPHGIATVVALFVAISGALTTFWTAYKKDNPSAADPQKIEAVTAKLDALLQQLAPQPQPPRVPSPIVPTPEPKPLPGETLKPPTEVPARPSGKVAAHVSFVTDRDVSPAINAVLNDAALGKWLGDAKVNSYAILTTDDSVVSGGLAVGVKAAGGAPCIVIQDANGAIIGQSRLTDSPAAKAFIRPFLTK